jgi:hypothetical protein
LSTAYTLFETPHPACLRKKRLLKKISPKHGSNDTYTTQGVLIVSRDTLRSSTQIKDPKEALDDKATSNIPSGRLAFSSTSHWSLAFLDHELAFLCGG